MEKEVKVSLSEPSEVLKKITQESRLRQRFALRQEFIQQQKEKYKKNEAKQDKKDLISKLKEVFRSES